MASETDKEVWFRAKTYGWGWGLPLTWQGWVVFGVYFGLLAFGIINLNGNILPIPFVPYFIVVTVALVVVCYLKGEKPRWRWGK